MTDSVTLHRPVGTEELAFLRAADFRAFPPRLPQQPIFYPVTNEACATRIARDWNARHNDDKRGYVTWFAVRANVLATYERKVVGGREHEEFWIPAEDVPAFNASITGPIEVIAEFGSDT